MQPCINYDTVKRNMFYKKIETALLKLFLIERLHHLLAEILLSNHSDIAYMECYTMDTKMIPALIKDIIETGDYTLEGISRYTHIPQDILLDAACGNINQISIGFWSNLINIYIQTHPEISQMLVDKLLEMKSQWHTLLK